MMKLHEVIGIYLDLQQAFDTTDHDVQLFEMNNIRGIVYKIRPTC